MKLVKKWKEQLPAEFVVDVEKNFSLMMSQLMLSTTFVEDLLDMKQLQEGVFRLMKEPFNPTEVIELIQQIFNPQVTQKKIKLTSTFWYDLESPFS